MSLHDLMLFLFLVFWVVLCWWIIRWYRRKEDEKPLYTNAQLHLSLKRKQARLQRVSPGLYTRLLGLLNGDKKTAQRLVDKARLDYPDQSEDWRYEKVIRDIERDRRL